MGALLSARVWCSAHEIPFEKRVPGKVCMERRVAISDCFENKSWSVSSGIFEKASSVGAKRVMGPPFK